jgi:hypothetical protein
VALKDLGDELVAIDGICGICRDDRRVVRR